MPVSGLFFGIGVEDVLKNEGFGEGGVVQVEDLPVGIDRIPQVVHGHRVCKQLGIAVQHLSPARETFFEAGSGRLQVGAFPDQCPAAFVDPFAGVECVLILFEFGPAAPILEVDDVAVPVDRAGASLEFLGRFGEFQGLGAVFSVDAEGNFLVADLEESLGLEGQRLLLGRSFVFRRLVASRCSSLSAVSSFSLAMSSRRPG